MFRSLHLNLFARLELAMARHVGRFVLACALATFALPGVRAQTAEPWTTVASTGTVDESDIPNVVFNGATAQVSSSAPLPYTVNITYSVVAVDGLMDSQPGKFIKARFTDNGISSRVILTLKEFELSSGILRTRLTFDSDASPAGTASQLVTRDYCTTADTSWQFDFTTKIYYVEAQIIRSNSSGTAILSAIQIGKRSC